MLEAGIMKAKNEIMPVSVYYQNEVPPQYSHQKAMIYWTQRERETGVQVCDVSRSPA
jgi:hypothetical protein